MSSNAGEQPCSIEALPSSEGKKKFGGKGFPVEGICKQMPRTLFEPGNRRVDLDKGVRAGIRNRCTRIVRWEQGGSSSAKPVALRFSESSSTDWTTQNATSPNHYLFRGPCGVHFQDAVAYLGLRYGINFSLIISPIRFLLTFLLSFTEPYVDEYKYSCPHLLQETDFSASVLIDLRVFFNFYLHIWYHHE